MVITYCFNFNNRRWGIWAYQNFSALPPEAAVLSAIEKTLNAESYRYHAISKKIVDNQEQLLSEVMGEKVTVMCILSANSM